MRSADWVPLTNWLAEGVKPSSREQFLWDAELKGFGLRVARSGWKTFFLQFRSPVDRRFCRLKLGRYLDLSVDAARTLAKKAKGDLYTQPDPAAERVQLRQRAASEMTLETLCSKFISEYAEKHRRSWKRDKPRFDLAGAVYKDLWKKRISEMVPADLLAMHNKITASNGPVTANRTFEAIRTAWNWTRSMRHHAMTENPADTVKRNREYSRERYLRPNEIIAPLGGPPHRTASPLARLLHVGPDARWPKRRVAYGSLGGFRGGNMDSGPAAVGRARNRRFFT